MNDVPPPLPSLAPSIPETVVGWGHVEGRTGGVGCQEKPQILDFAGPASWLLKYLTEQDFIVFGSEYPCIRYPVRDDFLTDL